MLRNLTSGLAARIVFFALAAAAIYWMLPSPGKSALKKMNAAMQNTWSWRMETVVTEPTKKVDTTVEVYCPSRFHQISRTLLDEGGTQREELTENFWIDGTSYAWNGAKWVTSQEENTRLRGTVSCTRGPRSTDALLDRMDLLLTTGKVRRGGQRSANGEICRDWIASVSAADGWRDEFGVCIGEGDLPREVFSPDRRMVETYSDWNTPIRIEAPVALGATLQ